MQVQPLCLVGKGVARKGVARKGVARKGVARKGVARKGVARKGVARKGVVRVSSGRVSSGRVSSGRVSPGRVSSGIQVYFFEAVVCCSFVNEALRFEALLWIEWSSPAPSFGAGKEVLLFITWWKSSLFSFCSCYNAVVTMLLLQCCCYNAVVVSLLFVFVWLAAGRTEKSWEHFIVSPDNEWLVFTGNDGSILLVSNKVRLDEELREKSSLMTSVHDDLSLRIIFVLLDSFLHFPTTTWLCTLGSVVKFVLNWCVECVSASSFKNCWLSGILEDLPKKSAEKRRQQSHFVVLLYASVLTFFRHFCSILSSDQTACWVF